MACVIKTSCLLAWVLICSLVFNGVSHAEQYLIKVSHPSVDANGSLVTVQGFKLYADGVLRASTLYKTSAKDVFREDTSKYTDVNLFSVTAVVTSNDGTATLESEPLYFSIPKVPAPKTDACEIQANEVVAQ